MNTKRSKKRVVVPIGHVYFVDGFDIIKKCALKVVGGKILLDIVGKQRIHTNISSRRVFKTYNDAEKYLSKFLKQYLKSLKKKLKNATTRLNELKKEKTNTKKPSLPKNKNLKVLYRNDNYDYITEEILFRIKDGKIEYCDSESGFSFVELGYITTFPTYAKAKKSLLSFIKRDIEYLPERIIETTKELADLKKEKETMV